MPFTRANLKALFRSSPDSMAAGGGTMKALLAWLGIGHKSAAGELVTEKTALEHADVYICVKIIAESIAGLPLKLYEQLDNGRQEAFDHPLHDLLAYQPNPEMTAFTFFEALAGSLALTGNCYAAIIRNRAGQPAALYPLHPWLTKPDRLNGQIVYITSDGEENGKTRVIPANDVLHVPLWSFDGLKGISPIKMAMESIGLAKAATKFGARALGNGSHAPGILTAPAGMDEEALIDALKSWEATQGGENQGRTALLPGDWKYTRTSISPDEAQFLETRKYQRTEIAALFRLPPNMIGDTTRMATANHEQMQLSFVTQTLTPYLVRFEQEIVRKLMPSVGRNAGRYFVKFDTTELLRGDEESMSAAHLTAIQGGWQCVNEVRSARNLNSIGPVGNVYLYDTRFANAEQLLKQPETEPIDQQPIVDPDTQLALPAPKDDDAPTQQERDVLGSLTSSYIRLFRDAVGRVSSREQRDSGLISQVFQPILRSISDAAEQYAAEQFDLSREWHGDLDGVVRDHLKAIDKRASSWTADGVDDIAANEMRKAVRALSINIFREAGARVALKGSKDDQAA